MATVFTGTRIETRRGQDRVHDRLAQFIVSTTALALATTLVRNCRRPGSEDGMLIASIQLRTDIQVPLIPAIQSIIDGRGFDGISISVLPHREIDYGPEGYSIDSMAWQKWQAYSAWPIFIEFYEAHKDWMQKNISKKTFEWPDVLRFGRVIRNSCSHRQTIMFPREDELPVRWRDISYQQSDNEKPFMFVDMALADFVFLMIDMADELDRLGCPLL